MLFNKESVLESSYAKNIEDAEIEHCLIVADRIRKNMNQAFTGKAQVVENVITALFAGGHVLLEDVPGVGKTLLAKSLAGSIDAGMSRIQFTSDMMPSDITGVTILDSLENKFVYHKGPIFNNVILADEINRAGPKSQAALLEVMEENQVTADGVTYPLPSLFFVIATQNPTDMQGTHPLPEAQKDRFMMQLEIGYPGLEGEIELLNDGHGSEIVSKLKPACSINEVKKVKSIVNRVHASYIVRKKIVELVARTRKDPKIRLGGSPRSSLQILKAAKTKALLSGREYVTPDDVKNVYAKILKHRVILNNRSNGDVEEILQEHLNLIK